MSQSFLLVSSGKKELQFTQKFIQSYDDESYKVYILEVNVSYTKRLQKIHSDLSFEIMKMEKCLQFLRNMYDLKNYVVHIEIVKLA